MDESKWQEVWKMICDVPEEQRERFFCDWDLVEDEEKAKETLCDTWKLDWSKDVADLKLAVAHNLHIQSELPQVESPGEWE